MKVTILGCGHSPGVPAIGNNWGQCDPTNPKNRRSRSSIHMEIDGVSLLVDTSPDLRSQLLNADIARIDAVLYTHGHADHLHGIDDLRTLNRLQNEAIDIYLNQETLDHISERFGYVLTPLDNDGTFFYKPVLLPNLITPGQSFSVKGVEIMPILQDHGFCETIGFRIGDFAYSTDVTAMPEESFALLDGVKTWVIATLTDKPHPTHADVDKAVAWIKRVGASQGYLTHLGGSLDYNALCERLESHIRPCFDGMTIEMQ